MDNNPFIKYIMKDDKEDILHSSAYGKVQGGGNMGSASTESFEDRIKMEKNRQIVKGYNDSKLAGSTFSNGPRAKKYTPPEKNEGIGMGVKPAGGVAGRGANPAPAPAQPKRSFAPPVKPNFGR